MAVGRLRRVGGILQAARRATRDFHRDPNRAPELSRVAARRMLELLEIDYRCIGAPIDPCPGLLVGNHISYIDVLLLYSQAHVSFLAKKEVGSWPIFGEAMRAAGTVFVQRDCSDSRTAARQTIADAILREGRKIAVFPEGTTSLKGKPWRHGPLEIAQQYGITVQPFRVRYSPARVCAFIDDDAFAPHLWKILGTPGTRATFELGEPIKITDARADALRLQEWASAT